MTFHCTQQLISLVNLKLSSLDQQSMLWDQYDKRHSSKYNDSSCKLVLNLFTWKGLKMDSA